ncbi:MAG: acetyl-coenzyme A synthetase N-terminal domain-containing protein, partial [Pseudomonadota bacterium]
MGYRAEYDQWKADPEGWWMAAADAIDWVTPPTKALTQRADDLYDWFAD